MSSKSVSNFRQRRKKTLLKICGEKCALCGYNKVVNALEFHHIYPEKKSYGISSSGNCHSLQKDITEIQKCILVCANCHREIHAGNYSAEELSKKQVFNFNILEKNFKPENTKRFCLNCGKSITKYSNSGLCSECSHITRRISERPSREELKQLIRENSFVKIGEMYSVSDNAIRKWCITYNLPSKKTEINNFTDEQWSKI